MAAIMGATYPDLYAAVGVHSGLAPGSANDLSSAFIAMRQGGPLVAHGDVPGGGDTQILPTIFFHGDGDTTVHPRNGDRLLAHLSGGREGSSLRVSTRRGRVQGGYEYTRFTCRDADGRDLVERWSVHGLGHAWSGGSYPGSYTDSRGPDASAEMVRFFEQHHKRQRDKDGDPPAPETCSTAGFRAWREARRSGLRLEPGSGVAHLRLAGHLR